MRSPGTGVRAASGQRVEKHKVGQGSASLRIERRLWWVETVSQGGRGTKLMKRKTETRCCRKVVNISGSLSEVMVKNQDFISSAIRGH